MRGFGAFLSGPEWERESGTEFHAVALCPGNGRGRRNGLNFFQIQAAADFQSGFFDKLVFIGWHGASSFLSHLPNTSKWDGISRPMAR